MRSEFRVAAIAGDLEAVEGLLAAGVEVDARDKYGQTALMLAARHGHSSVVTALLANGAGKDITAKYGLSALMLAVVNHHVEIAKRLVDAGADVSLRGSGDGGFAGKTAAELADGYGISDLAAYIALGGKGI